MPASKIRVAVLFGGRSSEHEVSVRSAAAVISAMDRNRYEAIPVAIDRQGRWLAVPESAALLSPDARARCVFRSVSFSHQPGESRGFDVVFPILHGPFGEDGRVQGFLDLADVPYVGSGVLGSACGMDKDTMKRLFRAEDLPTLPHVAVGRGEVEGRVAEIEQRIGYPAFVKPANLGSSVGIRRAEGLDELLPALRYAGEFDRKVVVEPAVDAREIECSVLGGAPPRASVPGEIVTRGGFYDYGTKYESDEFELAVPAQVEPDLAARIRAMAVAAFKAVGCEGLARVDFFLERPTGRLLLNEVNTMPGFTSISMFPKLWEASGLPYPLLIKRLLDLAVQRSADSRRVRFDPR